MKIEDKTDGVSNRWHCSVKQQQQEESKKNKKQRRQRENHVQFAEVKEKQN